MIKTFLQEIITLLSFEKNITVFSTIDLSIENIYMENIHLCQDYILHNQSCSLQQIVLDTTFVPYIVYNITFIEMLLVSSLLWNIIVIHPVLLFQFKFEVYNYNH